MQVRRSGSYTSQDEGRIEIQVSGSGIPPRSESSKRDCSCFPSPGRGLHSPRWLACEERILSYQPHQDFSGTLSTICSFALQLLYPARAVFLSVILPIPPQESRPAAASDPELSSWSSESDNLFH